MMPVATFFSPQAVDVWHAGGDVCRVSLVPRACTCSPHPPTAARRLVHTTCTAASTAERPGPRRPAGRRLCSLVASPLGNRQTTELHQCSSTDRGGHR